jgi:hypothetical protein
VHLSDKGLGQEREQQREENQSAFHHFFPWIVVKRGISARNKTKPLAVRIVVIGVSISQIRN